MAKIKLVAFDWNGVIIADASACARANNAVWKHFNWGRMTLAKYRQHYRVPIRDFWLSLGLDPKAYDKHSTQALKIFHQHYDPMENRCRSRSGVKQSLAWLAEEKISRIIFSNHPVEHIQRQLVRMGLAQYFSHIIGRDTTVSHMHGRSKGPRLRAYANSQKIKASEILVVGDTDEEIEIANEFGFTSVALTHGHQLSSNLRRHNPNYLIRNLKNLIIIISKINGRIIPRN